MSKRIILIFTAVGMLLSSAVFAQNKASFVPGTRTMVLAHNAYPDHGKYSDRLDRAIASGLPFATEQDLAWVDGKSLEIHGAKNVGTNDPTLESFFFPKIKPIMEEALKSGNKEKWPLVILYLDIKNDPPEHLQSILKTLDKYDSWITTALKSDDLKKQSPLDLKPLMILVEDKQNDIKQKYFYDDVPVGGKIRIFGSATKFNDNPNKFPKEKMNEALALLPGADIKQLLTAKADNYHRWFGTSWEFVELRGEKTGDWSDKSNQRLKEIVNYGHKMGYFVGFYCLDGFSKSENQGWDEENNFGSKEKVEARWKAAVQAHADFITTDQMEDLAKVIKSLH